MVSGSCRQNRVGARKSLRVRIMACPAVVDVCMHPLLLKTCSLLGTILFWSFYFCP